MREDTRSSENALSESPETLARQYQSLLEEGVRLAEEFGQADKTRRPRLAKALDRLFATRLTTLRQSHILRTLDDGMPALRAIEQRKKHEDASWNAARVTDVFNPEDRRPAHLKMAESGELYRRTFGIESHEPALTPTEMDEFKRVRRTILEEIGCRFIFGEGPARYTNSLSFVKDKFVVHLAHDALPTKGLPNAHRISGLLVLAYVDGHTGGHVVSYQRGRWTERAKDPCLQRMIDEIAAVVG